MNDVKVAAVRDSPVLSHVASADLDEVQRLFDTPHFTRAVGMRVLKGSHEEGSDFYLTVAALSVLGRFAGGEQFVMVNKAQGSAPGWKPRTMNLIRSWDDLVQVHTKIHPNWLDVLLPETEANYLFGWKRPFNELRPASRSAQVEAEAEKLRIEREAKRKVTDENTPVQDLKLISLEDLQNAPAPDWWINGFIPKNAIVVVGGDGGVGKSATLVEMSARLTTATPFLGEYGTRKARVLYAVGEGMSGYRPRLEAVASAHGLDPDQFRLVEGVSLTSERSVTQIAQTVADGKVDVVIFDTLSSLTTLESENDAAEVARVLGAAKRIREANEGCTAIIVHHTNKASGGLRGSSVIRDNADVVWMLKGDSDAFFMSNKSKHGGKMKDGAEIEVHGLSLIPTLDSIVVESSHEARGVQPDARSGPRLLGRLTHGLEYDRATLFQLAREDQPDASDSTLKRLVTSLAADGSIARVGHGKYALPKGSPKGSKQ